MKYICRVSLTVFIIHTTAFYHWHVFKIMQYLQEENILILNTNNSAIHVLMMLV